MNEEPYYSLRASMQPDTNGYYVVEVYRRGVFQVVRMHEDRAEAIVQANRWITDDRDIVYEIIPVDWADEMGED